MKKTPNNRNIDQEMLDFFRKESRAPKEELMSLTLTADDMAASRERYKNLMAERDKANDGKGEGDINAEED